MTPTSFTGTETIDVKDDSRGAPGAHIGLGSSSGGGDVAGIGTLPTGVVCMSTLVVCGVAGDGNVVPVGVMIAVDGTSCIGGEAAVDVLLARRSLLMALGLNNGGGYWTGSRPPSKTSTSLSSDVGVSCMFW